MKHKKTILIVDDDPLILSILSKKLTYKMKNINILKALTYKDAVKHILSKDENIDIAILDLNLPEVENGAIVKFVSKKDIPIVVLTGINDDELKEILLSYNILDYIMKNSNKSIDYTVNKVYRVLKNYETNILVVDDSPVQIAMIVNILEKMKFNISTATNGLEAYDILQNSGKKFSLILTDYSMPKMDGMDLTLKVREEYGKDEIVIIVLSASDTPEISSQFISMGANDFINKPYLGIEVATRINSNLELLELFERIKDMANKDFLTGAYNRRFFFNSGEAIFEKAKRSKKDLVVAMLDIDKFKNINDTYGHDVGDIAILKVVDILDANLRDSDLLSRFGGEEFCLLLENISYEDMERLFEKIRKVFEENIIKIDDLEIKFTVSIGIYYGLENNLEEMIKRADDSLYYCKNNGRNKIAINNSTILC